MKLLLPSRLILVLLTGLAACHPQPTTRISRTAAPALAHYQPGQTPLISFHRGGGDYPGYPENCIESFDYVAKQMPVIIECDITLTRDSVAVMMHDETLDRTTTGKGRVNEYTYAQLQPLVLKDNKGTLSPYHIPTLEAVLRWGKDRVMYTLDVKKSVPFEKVVDLIHKTGAAPYSIVITYNAADAALVHRLDPDLMLSVTVRNEEEYQRHREAGVPDNRMVAFIGTREPNAAHCQFLHAKGIRCILGTLGNLDQRAAARGDSVYRTYVKAGADILSSDRPLEAWRVLSK